MKFSSPILLSLTGAFSSVKGWELGRVTVSSTLHINEESRQTDVDNRYFNLEDDGSIFRRLNYMKLKGEEKTSGDEKIRRGWMYCEETTVYDSSNVAKFTAPILIFGDSLGTMGPRNLGRVDPIGSRTFAVGDYFDISFDETRYPIFEYQDYSIEEPAVELLDGGDGFFDVALTYPVGTFVDNMLVTLYKKTCDVEVSGNDNAIALQTNTKKDYETNQKFVKYVQKVRLDSKFFSASDLLSYENFGKSSGTFYFCAEAETLLSTDGDEISVAFVKSDISVSFNLTQNTFSVDENTIQANTISTSDQNITTEYGVNACLCTDSTACDDNSGNPFVQNGLVYVCIYPDSNSLSSTEISNFNMKFTQNGAVVYTAVSNTLAGAVSNPLSNILGTSDKYRVVSRLITALFEGDQTSFNITGNAFLTFKTLRHLEAMQNSNLRSIQDAPTSKNAGESQFQMTAKITKDSKKTFEGSKPTDGVIVFIVGGFLALSIVFVLFKKMKK